MLVSSYNSGRFFGFIAEENGKSIGYITVTLGFEDADIESVYVLPEYRNRGVAFALINCGTEFIKRNNKSAILLEVKDVNEKAYNLYVKNGFSQISVRKKYYSDGHDALILKKEI